jgi:CPA1 family monovalent cation:H+ antiporter
LSKKIKLPFAVILVVFGIIIEYVARGYTIASFKLTPEILFFVLLPILLFESAFKIDYRKFRKDISIITILATVGVILASLITGVLISMFLGLPLFIGFLFATIISSTDPIAVISIFKELGVSRRLILIIDSESMLNDGTSVILAKIILSFLTAGVGAYSLVLNLVDFAYVISASIAIGMLGGYLASQVIKFIKNDFLIEITTTIALAYLVFIISEEILGASGIISTVVAGIMVGNYGRDMFSPKIKYLVKDLWEYLAFVANSLVFLLVGLSSNFFENLSENWFNIFGVYIFVCVGRALSVYLLTSFYNAVTSKDSHSTIPLSWMHVMNWGGLRGALPIAVILFLPSMQPGAEEILIPYQELLLNYTIGTVILSLIINGITIKPLIRFLKVDQLTPAEEIESDLMKTFVLSKGIKRIRHLEKIGEIKEHGKFLNEKYLRKFKRTANRLKVLIDRYPVVAKQVLFQFTFSIEKEIFISLREKKIISEKIFKVLEEKLLEDIDLVERGVFPESFKSVKVAKSIAVKSKTDFNLEELFLYRKAREFANVEVLERLYLFDNIPVLQKPISIILKTYRRWYDENKMDCNNLEVECGEMLTKFEAQICEGEFLATEENIIHQLEIEGKMSPTALRDLQVALVGDRF